MKPCNRVAGKRTFTIARLIKSWDALLDHSNILRLDYDEKIHFFAYVFTFSLNESSCKMLTSRVLHLLIINKLLMRFMVVIVSQKYVVFFFFIQNSKLIKSQKHGLPRNQLLFFNNLTLFPFETHLSAYFNRKKYVFCMTSYVWDLGKKTVVKISR